MAKVQQTVVETCIVTALKWIVVPTSSTKTANMVINCEIYCVNCSIHDRILIPDFY